MNVKFYTALVVSFLFAVIGAEANDVEVVGSISEPRILDTETDLHVTSADNPISASIDVRNEESFLYFDNVKPETLLDKYGSYITVNGEAMQPDVNCRLAIYRHGCVVTPRGTDFEPLTTYTSVDFAGQQQSHAVGLYYSNAPAEQVEDELRASLDNDNAIRSFRLKRGYMATFACESDGTGYSRCFIADKEDLEVAELQKELAGKISFVRVFRWNDVTKKGWVGSIDNGQTADCRYVRQQTDKVNGTWYYNWSPTTEWTSEPGNTSVDYNHEFVPEKWGYGGEDDWKAILNNRTSSHLNGYNEPDHTEQSNVSVERAIEEWPRMLQSGMRLGSPATTDNRWLFEFVRECRKKNYRVDYVNIHAYWGGMTGRDWYNELKKVHDATGLPIWITEWNNGANWTHESWPSGDEAQKLHQLEALKGILQVLDTCSFVERYSIYNWVEDKRALLLNGQLTPAGEYYAADTSELAYRADMQVVPEWNINESPVLSYTYRPLEKSIQLSWSDSNGEQVGGFVLDREYDGESEQVFKTSSSYDKSFCDPVVKDKAVSNVDYTLWNLDGNGNKKKYSNKVGYSVVDNSTAEPYFFNALALNSWKLYAFGNSYEQKPILLQGVPTDRIKTALTFRVKGLDEYSMQFRLKNWEYQGVQTYNYPDTLACALLSSGTTELAGMSLVVDSIENVTDEWMHVSFPKVFDTVPVVVASSQTSNNDTAYLVRIKNVTCEGFDVSLNFEEKLRTEIKAVGETVAYMAATEGQSEWNGMLIEAGRTPEESVGDERSDAYVLNLKSEFADVPFFFGSFQTCSDDVAASPRIKKRSVNEVTLFREREISSSTDRVAPESLGYIAVGEKATASGISDIENSVSTGHFEVFSVNGYKILEGEKFADNFSADLPAGIYVLRKDGISSKIIIGK